MTLIPQHILDYLEHNPSVGRLKLASDCKISDKDARGYLFVWEKENRHIEQVDNGIENVIVISDTHCGCQFGLCPPSVPLDGGGTYSASDFQLPMWYCFEEFCNKWIPMVTKGHPFALVHNGDALDGIHHRSVTQISQNIADQLKIAKMVLEPLVKRAAVYYHIRGTEAHVGQSGQYEEMLAQSLGAKPEGKNYARYELWLRLKRPLIHFSHHIGTTGSNAYEATAVHKEMVEAFVEAGRWRHDPPDVVCRSHRHRQFETRIATHSGYGISLVTPGWQLKTPFVFKLPGARAAQPQIGGYLIRKGDEDEVYTRFKVWEMQRPAEEVI